MNRKVPVTMKKMNMKVVSAMIIVMAALGYLIYTGVSQTSVYYQTVSEVVDRSAYYQDRSARVSGKVVEGSVDYNQEKLLLNFTVSDTEYEDRTMQVRYVGVLPDAFEDGAEVIIEGTFDGKENLFHSSVLLAKCPSKYVAEVQE